MNLNELTKSIAAWLDDILEEDSDRDSIFDLHIRKDEDGYDFIGFKMTDEIREKIAANV